LGFGESLQQQPASQVIEGSGKAPGRLREGSGRDPGGIREGSGKAPGRLREGSRKARRTRQIRAPRGLRESYEGSFWTYIAFLEPSRAFK